MDLDRQREWDEAVRLHFYNKENELLLHGEPCCYCSVKQCPVDIWPMPHFSYFWGNDSLY